MPTDGRKPVDMREVIARLVDGSDFLEFKAAYGPATVCAHADIDGMPVGIITNNGPIDPAGVDQGHALHPGLLPERASRSSTCRTPRATWSARSPSAAGMIKHGSKMIQAVANATVPQLTMHCGASFGAGNYGMCGRGFAPRFLFAWPNTRTAVMGAEQAASTMAIVMEDSARGARPASPTARRSKALRAMINATFERQTTAFYTSGRMLDDGVIDPARHAPRARLLLSLFRRPDRVALRPLDFGVARP